MVNNLANIGLQIVDDGNRVDVTTIVYIAHDRVLFMVMFSQLFALLFHVFGQYLVF